MMSGRGRATSPFHHRGSEWTFRRSLRQDSAALQVATGYPRQPRCQAAWLYNRLHRDAHRIGAQPNSLKALQACRRATGRLTGVAERLTEFESRYSPSWLRGLPTRPTQLRRACLPNGILFLDRVAPPDEAEAARKVSAELQMRWAVAFFINTPDLDIGGAATAIPYLPAAT